MHPVWCAGTRLLGDVCCPLRVLPQLAIAWCAANPHCSSVILGATRLSQLEDTLGAVDVVPKLTPAVMEVRVHCARRAAGYCTY